MLKESKELRIIESIEVEDEDFSEIGYFNWGTWIDAKNFEDSNSEGWRLPTIEEAKNMIKYKRKLTHMCGNVFFWFWTSDNEYRGARYFSCPGGTTGYIDKFSNEKIFLIR